MAVPQDGAKSTKLYCHCVYNFKLNIFSRLVSLQYLKIRDSRLFASFVVHHARNEAQLALTHAKYYFQCLCVMPVATNAKGDDCHPHLYLFILYPRWNF